MKRILIFSGTTEGRRLCELLAENGISCTVCVATEYGETVMEKSEKVTIRTGRMNRQEMTSFLKDFGDAVVVDATHPYATEVSENIRLSAREQSLPYLRLKRQTNMEKEGVRQPFVQYFEDNEACVQALLASEGNILLTTGSKELSVYCREETLRKRLYVRVLPGQESISLCEEAGLTGKQIIALQGPFSEELNAALMRQFSIRHMVTKESGRAGGFLEKVNAAESAKVNLLVIGNPEKEEGLSFSGVCKELEKILGKTLSRKSHLTVSLIGVGMGNADTMTGEAERAWAEADYVFGAQRVIANFSKGKKAFPCYLAKDLIPKLTQIMQEEYVEEDVKAVVLFSGDSGFYSGCEKLYQALCEWKKELPKEQAAIRIYPGISSVAYLAAAAGINWQDAKLMSVHGKGGVDHWKSSVLHTVRSHEKTFLLLSGVQDIQQLGNILWENGCDRCNIAVGYQLSYEEEMVMWCTPKDCRQFTKEGLYSCFILNPEWNRRVLSPGTKDSAFIREQVPMSKEEIRELVICKLRLREDSVVYDIGSGTGSVSVDIGKLSGGISVYAIEHKMEAAKLTERNVKNAGLYNVSVVEKSAPEAFDGLVPATHAFIGGSSGNLKEIVNKLYEVNPRMRVVMTAVSLETVAQINEILGSGYVAEEEIISVQVSRAKNVGNYHLMQAENPIYMASFTFRDV